MSLLRIAVPNKGSLAQSASDILRESGYRQRDEAKQLLIRVVGTLAGCPDRVRGRARYTSTCTSGNGAN